MVEQKYGKIVSISSDSARAGQMNECLYCGTKGAIITSSKGLAREFARYNINVNVISPGIADTPLIQELRSTERGEKIIQATTKMIPFRRIGQPSEIGDLAVFFASEESKYITGQVLSINGGQQMIG
jgi:2-hydroxycyclohexanecarboxyl-CoA dehydrogenase